MDQIKEIFLKVTERYSVPVRVGSRCEAHSFYRVDNLTTEDVEVCAGYVADRVIKVCSPNLPVKIINLPGGYTGLADWLSRELAPPGEELEVIPFGKLEPANGKSASIRGVNVVLVSDVITTARSCLEAHTKVTMLGSTVLCWASLVDRTFGPGPVPVVAAFTGEPVTMLEELP